MIKMYRYIKYLNVYIWEVPINLNIKCPTSSVFVAGDKKKFQMIKLAETFFFMVLVLCFIYTVYFWVKTNHIV